MNNICIHRIEVDEKTTKEELVRELAQALSSVDNLRKEKLVKDELINELRNRIIDKDDMIIILKEQLQNFKDLFLSDQIDNKLKIDEFEKYLRKNDGEFKVVDLTPQNETL